MDTIDSKKGVSLDRLPSVKVKDDAEKAKHERSHKTQHKTDSSAAQVSFSNLARSIHNNAQATHSLNKVAKENKSGDDVKRSVAEANKDSSKTSVEDVVALAEHVSQEIVDSPDQALAAHGSPSAKARELL